MLSKLIENLGDFLRSPARLKAPNARKATAMPDAADVRRSAHREPSQTTDRLNAYRQALEEHFCITVTDSNGRLLEVNGRFCEVTGYTEDELIGQHYDLLSSGRHTNEFIDEMWDTVRAGKTWRGEFCDRSKSGSEIWFESIVIPRFNAQGTIDHFVTISTDTTQIFQAASR